MLIETCRASRHSGVLMLCFNAHTLLYFAEGPGSLLSHFYRDLLRVASSRRSAPHRRLSNRVEDIEDIEPITPHHHSAESSEDKAKV